MDVSKLFAKSKEQEETVSAATKISTILSKQKGSSIITETEDIERFEDEGGAFSEEIFERPVDAWVSITSSFIPDRHPLSQRFHELLKEIGELHDKKQKDYGTANDPFANVRGATEFGLSAPMGAFIAMNDCMQRVKSFCKNGKLENEPLDNALRDMAVYSLIALVLWEEENETKT